MAKKIVALLNWIGKFEKRGLGNEEKRNERGGGSNVQVSGGPVIGEGSKGE